MMPGSAVSVVRRRRRHHRRRRRRPQSTFSSKYVRNAVLRAVPTLPTFQPAAMRTYGRGRRRRRRHRRTLVKYRTEEKQGEDEDDEEAVEKEDYVRGGVVRGRGNGEKNLVNVKRRRRLLRVK